MSYQALNWCSALDLGPRKSSAKFVLFILANYADEDGRCFPTLAQIAAATHLTERTISTCLADLQAWRLISLERERREDGSFGRNRYRLHLDRLERVLGEDAEVGAVECAPVDDPAEKSSGGEAADSQRKITASPAENNAAPEENASGPYNDKPPIEPPSEPSVERERAGARDDGDGKGKGKGKEAEPEKAITLHDKRWAVFWRWWPNSDVDDPLNARAAWNKLAEDDLQPAIDGIKPFQAALKAKGRKHLPAAASYLRGRKWQDLGKPDPDGKPKPKHETLAPWGAKWMAVLVDHLATGDPRRAKFMIASARKKQGHSVDLNQPHVQALMASTEQFQNVAAHFDVWQDFVRWAKDQAAGWYMDFPRFRSTPESPFWLSLPPADERERLGIGADVSRGSPSETPREHGDGDSDADGDAAGETVGEHWDELEGL